MILVCFEILGLENLKVRFVAKWKCGIMKFERFIFWEMDVDNVFWCVLCVLYYNLLFLMLLPDQV